MLPPRWSGETIRLFAHLLASSVAQKPIFATEFIIEKAEQDPSENS
jgi:hypothetical protein